MTRDFTTKAVLAGLLMLALLTCSSCVYVHIGDSARVRFERQVELTAPLPAGSSFSAETGDGSIAVRGAETDQCRVVATIVAHARTEEQARQLAEQIEPKLEPADRGLKVVTNRPPAIDNAWYTVSLDVQVPQQTNLVLKTGDGAITIARVTGNVEARTSDGSINAEGVKGDVKLRTSDGGITVARLQAETLDLHTGDGGISLTEIRADTLTAETGDGSIRGQELAIRRAEYRTADGSIHIDSAADAPKAPDITATTSSGGITFTAPPGLSATLEAATDDGSIRLQNLSLTTGSSHGKSLTGTVGAGEGKVRLRTHDGSITIR